MKLFSPMNILLVIFIAVWLKSTDFSRLTILDLLEIAAFAAWLGIYLYKTFLI